jgi:hypothetical protein
VEAVAHPGVDRVEEKGEKEGPEDRAEERLQDPIERDGGERRDREAEDPGIEAVVGSQGPLLPGRSPETLRENTAVRARTSRTE